MPVMLDERLEAALDLLSAPLAGGRSVAAGGRWIDVGTDHARLPVATVERGLADKAYALDIRPGPLEAAERQIIASGLEDRITTILSDGLDKLPPEPGDRISVLGMGGREIIAILKSCTLPAAGRLVLQPMQNAAELRSWLAENGLGPTNERVVVSGRHVYVLESVELSVSVPVRRLNLAQQTIGPCLLEDSSQRPDQDTWQRYLLTLLRRWRKQEPACRKADQAWQDEWVMLGRTLKQLLGESGEREAKSNGRS